MSLTQTIEIDGQPVNFRASAAIPRIYRLRFHRDIYKDLSLLENAAHLGLPIPKKLKEVLEHLHHKHNEEDDKHD